MTPDLKKYQKLLELEEETKFVKIDHDDAMVAKVYQVERPAQPHLILKICEDLNHYNNELYFLKFFAEQIPVPTVINTLELICDLTCL